jgi:hypothetical protein
MYPMKIATIDPTTISRFHLASLGRESQHVAPPFDDPYGSGEPNETAPLPRRLGGVATKHVGRHSIEDRKKQKREAGSGQSHYGESKG